MRRPAVLWAVALGAAAVLAAEWMRRPTPALAAALALAALAGAWGAWRSGTPLRRVPLTIAVALAALTAIHAWTATTRLERTRHDWPAVRDAAVARASRRLGGELDAAAGLARALAARAAPALARSPEAAFAELDRLVGARGPSHGVVLYDTHGHLRAWGGVQRVRPEAAGPEFSVITTPFYLWLVARRQTSAGTAAAVVLLARADDVPPSAVALTDRFAQRTGVGLRFLPHVLAPPGEGILDYVSPAARGDTLFAVETVPPAQGDLYERALGEARRTAAVLVLLLLVTAAAGGTGAGLGGPATAVAAIAALTALARAPLRETFGPGSPFWPDTYFTGLLGPYSSSAGALLLLAIVAFALASALWRRGLRPTWPRVALAIGGTLLAPYVLQRLARGITPPAAGVPVGLWLLWQAALALSASAIVLAAASLVRGASPPRPARLRPVAASGIALAAALAGLWLWQPNGAWPAWYPYLWAPALLLALRPMPFRTALATIAVVAGSSAALLTWGAAAEGRMVLAARDVEGLGDRADPFALALLERQAGGPPPGRPLANAGDLFLLWRRSPVGSQGYPASLAVWERGLGRTLSLDLAELDLPPVMVQSVAAEALGAGRPVLRSVLRAPGTHAVAAMPLPDGRVLTVGVGPRSRLVAPTRLAQFLLGTASETEAPYDVTLAPGRGTAAPGAPVAWRREGWALRGERVLALPGGTRHAHAVVDLRGPSAVLQRGALVLVFDIVLLVTLWALLELASGRARPAVAAWWRRSHGSLRLRLSVSLALFFVTPTLAFALWSFGRLEDEFRGTRELLLQRTLRDAAAALGPPDAPGAAIAVAARQVGAELLLSRGGSLVASSAPVLADLGLVDLLVPGRVYARLAWGDEVEDAAPQAAAPAPTLVGYRVLGRSDPAAPVIMASPEFLGDRALRRREADLGTAVLVASVLGVLAALVLSGVAARRLARPIDRLRRAALGVGAGEPPDDIGTVPAELEPVRDALRQAARDVEAGQRAQRVLAWGEMARQVAHEIKNPLTPIRLGVQHLLRVARERPDDLGRQLPDTGERILTEIDRLDATARAFSRFAMPGGAAAAALETVDMATVVRDVVHLYRMGEGPVEWETEIVGAPLARARRDELTEVLVNLCENARDAGARRVAIAARAETGRVTLLVRDDGAGIPADVLPRVFEPRFSTTTSGSGLGLAIARRLVESWGGEIGIASTDGAGTTVRVTLAAP